MAGAIKRTKATNQMMWKKAGTLKKKLKYSDLTEYQMVLKGYYLRYILLDKTFFHNYLLPHPQGRYESFGYGSYVQEPVNILKYSHNHKVILLKKWKIRLFACWTSSIKAKSTCEANRWTKILRFRFLISETI